jgi:hypothetical protein
MWRQASLVALAAVLAIPPARFVLMPRPPAVDRTTPEWKAREAIIARARVFDPDSPDARTSDYFDHIVSEVSCEFVPKKISGTTPKFDCRQKNGDVVKIKYGWSPERYGEVAATKLLAALGFGADRVEFVEHVRCFGCPKWPFEMRILAEQFFLAGAFERGLNYKSSHEFDWATIEHKAKGREVEVDDFEGWDWRELALVKTSAGGATPEELDALRLISVFLAHWDNKNTNQRLLCKDEACKTPLLILQDMGATFGPTKVNYDAWSALPIWKDAAGCVVSMETLPYEGVLFPPVQISEGGRALLAARLKKMSEAQIHALFRGARFPDPVSGNAPAHDLTPWVRAFQKKVREIADRPPCPSLS